MWVGELKETHCPYPPILVLTSIAVRGGGGQPPPPPFCQAGPDHGQKDHGKNNQLEPTIQQ